MIITLSITLVMEGIVIAVYSFWQTKPLVRLLLASLLVNLLTQPMLWALLNLFSGHYLITLFLSEVFIWLIEGILLNYFPGTRLEWSTALLLSLGMNLASFWIGWFLPV